MRPSLVHPPTLDQKLSEMKATLWVRTAEFVRELDRSGLPPGPGELKVLCALRERFPESGLPHMPYPDPTDPKKEKARAELKAMFDKLSAASRRKVCDLLFRVEHDVQMDIASNQAASS